MDGNFKKMHEGNGLICTGCSLNIVFLKFCDFSELCKFCCSAGVLLPVYTHWHWGKTEKGKSPEYFKIFKENTIFNEHPVYAEYKTEYTTNCMRWTSCSWRNRGTACSWMGKAGAALQLRIVHFALEMNTRYSVSTISCKWGNRGPRCSARLTGTALLSALLFFVQEET